MHSRRTVSKSNPEGWVQSAVLSTCPGSHLVPYTWLLTYSFLPSGKAPSAPGLGEGRCSLAAPAAASQTLVLLPQTVHRSPQLCALSLPPRFCKPCRQMSKGMIAGASEAPQALAMGEALQWFWGARV